MIGLLQGEVVFLAAPTACILTASGVGYDVELPLTSFCHLALENQVTIWTHLHVREDAQLIFGFVKRSEREVFRKLIKINGVGAKMALAMLSSMSVGELKMHVEQGNDMALTRIPGIGKKTAQRLLIELKDKLRDINTTSFMTTQLLAGEIADTADTDYSQSDSHINAEVEGALVSLGYREKEAKQAIEAARASKNTANDEAQFEDTQALLKATLKQLSTF